MTIEKESVSTAEMTILVIVAILAASVVSGTMIMCLGAFFNFPLSVFWAGFGVGFLVTGLWIWSNLRSGNF